MDYLSFFGLRTKAFVNVCRPEFYYEGNDHVEALNRLIYLVEEGNMGFGVLTGEIGCGKTMTRQVFKDRLDPKDYAVYDFDQCSVEFPYILYDLLMQMGEGDIDPQLTPEQPYFLIKAFEYFVQHHNAKMNRSTVIIFDEAQMLSPDAMLELKNLTNINSHVDSPLTIIFVGQPELRGIIKSLPPIDQRVSLRYHLKPLKASEVKGYVEQRLKVVGHPDGHLFEDKAVALIAKYTRGIPREINRVCQLSLHFSASQGEKVISPDTALTVLKDLAKQQGSG